MTALGYALDGSGLLLTQLPRTTHEAWRRFVHAITIADEITDPSDPGYQKPRRFEARTPAGGLGCFDLRPLRLADLGLMRDVHRSNVSGRSTWVGTFVLPMTHARFLGAPLVQYNALIESLRRYDQRLSAAPPPTEISRSGALALLHRLGPHALTKWTQHQEPTTLALLERANGLF